MRSCNTQSFLYLTTEYKCFSKKTNLLFFHWLLSVLQQHHGIKITQIYLGTDSAVWSIENNTSLTYSIRNILEGKKLFAFQLERIRTWLFLDLFFHEKHLYKIYLKTKVFLGAAIEGQPRAGSQHGSNGVSVRGLGHSWVWGLGWLSPPVFSWRDTPQEAGPPRDSWKLSWTKWGKLSRWKNHFTSDRCLAISTND